jgi:hypothetical protein
MKCAGRADARTISNKEYTNEQYSTQKEKQTFIAIMKMSSEQGKLHPLYNGASFAVQREEDSKRPPSTNNFV